MVLFLVNGERFVGNGRFEPLTGESLYEFQQQALTL